MATSQTLRVAIKSLTPLRFRNTVDVDTSSMLLEVYLVDPDTTSTQIKVGEDYGAAAGTDFTIACDFATAGVTVGRWLLYVVEATANPNKLTAVPNKKTAMRVFVEVYDNPVINT